MNPQSFIVLVIFHSCHVASSVDDIYHAIKWKKIEPSFGEHFKLEIIGDTRISRSIYDCMTKCHDHFKACNSVVFDDVSGSCTLGESVIRTSVSPSPFPEGSIYMSDNSAICDETLGFLFIKHGDLSACVLVSTKRIAQSVAKQDCGTKGGILYTAKSVDRVNLCMANLATTEDTFLWIGLEDVHVDNEFYWADGEHFVRGSSYWFGAWDPSQPNKPMEQMCVVINTKSGKFHDDFCYSTRRFVCEIVPNPHP